jgi:hypothetical protein
LMSLNIRDLRAFYISRNTGLFFSITSEIRFTIFTLSSPRLRCRALRKQKENWCPSALISFVNKTVFYKLRAPWKEHAENTE